MRGKTQELIGSRGIFQYLEEKSVSLRHLNVVGVRSIDLMCEAGCAVMVASEETTRLNNLKVQNILPKITGDTVSVYIKVQKKIVDQSPHLKGVIDWIFKCRDIQLTKVDIKIEYPHMPLLRKASGPQR